MLESSSDRFELGSSLYAKCSGCSMSEFLASGNHPQYDVNPRTLQGKDVNRRMLFAAFESGIGKEGVAKFCEVFSMPFNISPATAMKRSLVKPSKRKQVNSYKRTAQKPESLPCLRKLLMMMMMIM